MSATGVRRVGSGLSSRRRNSGQLGRLRNCGLPVFGHLVATGNHTQAKLLELFGVSRTTNSRERWLTLG